MALVGPRSKVRPALPQWVPRCRESSFSSDDGRRSSKGHGGEGVATTIPRSFERRRLTRRFTHSRALSLRDFARIYLLGKQNDVPSKRSIGRGSYLCEFLPSSFESPISFLLSGGSTGAPCILLMSLFFLACLLASFFSRPSALSSFWWVLSPSCALATTFERNERKSVSGNGV
jgi:hypothetical protein